MWGIILHILGVGLLAIIIFVVFIVAFEVEDRLDSRKK